MIKTLTLIIVTGCVCFGVAVEGLRFVSPAEILIEHQENEKVDGEEIQLDGFEHFYTENDGVKLHYVSGGSGPLVVMLHGFPDFWYTWRNHMSVLKSDYQVVAMDLRGYNLSGQPKDVQSYKMQHLLDDVAAVIKACGKKKATVVGHDWGGAIAWQLAINRPELVEQLVVCNMVHPTGASRAALKTLRGNDNTSYMDTLRGHSKETLPVSWMSGWVNDSAAKHNYTTALGRSSVDGMLNYYRANTKTKQQRAEWLSDPKIREQPNVVAPVLVIFGLKDKYVNKNGLNDCWNWVDGEFSLATFPNAGHFVQQDESDKVSKRISGWLKRNK